MVWKLDRLGRTLMGILGSMQTFEANNITLVSLTERFDLASPMGKGMFHIMASLAQMERDLIRERTMASMRAAKERGKRHSWPQTMTPERIKKATELIAAGVSDTKIIPAMQAITGPTINKSRVYDWVRKFKEQQNTQGTTSVSANPSRRNFQ